MLKGKKIFLQKDFSRKTEDGRKSLYSYVKASNIAGGKHTSRVIFSHQKANNIQCNTVKNSPLKYQPSNNATWYGDNGVILFCGFPTLRSQTPIPPISKLEVLMRLAVTILATKSPLHCYKLGHRVKGFKADEWTKVQQTHMLDGAVANFTQNPGMSTFLKDKRN